jgi:hypothetical protein
LVSAPAGGVVSEIDFVIPEKGRNIDLPEKIPILFVHGAVGSPKGWEYFVNNIDRARFQPWFFYYPTGARIKSMSYLLFWKLFNLQIKYKFNALQPAAERCG